jgi:hypothetical protein
MIALIPEAEAQLDALIAHYEALAAGQLRIECTLSVKFPRHLRGL